MLIPPPLYLGTCDLLFEPFYGLWLHNIRMSLNIGESLAFLESKENASYLYSAFS